MRRPLPERVQPPKMKPTRLARNVASAVTVPPDHVFTWKPQLPITFLDAETFSYQALRKNKPLNGHDATCGGWEYAQHHSTEALMWSYQDGTDGTPYLWDATDPDTPYMPKALCDQIAEAQRGERYLCAHNGINFDRLILKYVHKMDVPVYMWLDTMLIARQANLPSSLKGLGAVLQVSDQKLEEESKLIQFFCKPFFKRAKGQRTLERRTRDTHPDKWADFCRYGLRDTVTLAAIWKKIPKINWTGPRGDFERRMIYWDSVINDRGFRVHRELAIAARDAVANYKGDLFEETHDEHGINIASNDQFLATLQDLWPAKHIPQGGKGAATKGTMQEYLRDPDIPDAARELIGQRMEATSKGGGKFEQLLYGSAITGRYRGAFEYGKASTTLRWTGSRFGAMNLARGTYHNGDEGVWSWDERELDRGINMLLKGTARLRYDIPKLAASVTRACILPDEGEEIHVSDFSNVEGRLAFALAGGARGVQKFIDADNGGPGVYELAAAGMFGIPVADVTKDQRQIGKLISLSCQYGSGVSGFCGFAKGYNFNVEAMCDRLAGTMPDKYWRRSHSMYEFFRKMRLGMGGLNERNFRIVWCLIEMWRDAAEKESGLVTLWHNLENAAFNAMRHPGRAFWAGERVRADGKRAFKFWQPVRKATNKPRPWLFMELPSGRVVMFAQPELRQKTSTEIDPATGEKQKSTKLELVYQGADEETGVWGTQKLYGGKIMAIGTQSTAREFQAESIVRVCEDGKKVILHVHDEIGASIPKTDPYKLRERMCVVPQWFWQDWPLTGSASVLPYYQKD